MQLTKWFYDGEVKDKLVKVGISKCFFVWKSVSRQFVQQNFPTFDLNFTYCLKETARQSLSGKKKSLE